ncbi:MAG TPA: glycosyltransferase family 39 protein [Methylomirabilota bacterium]|nr:glycosyltransferase family 39 protein [Methylomirabilota bacterium]
MSTPRSRTLLWLAAALAMVTIDLGRGVLSTNDEARFAVLGQDILARGSWLFPELNGVTYHNKPPLLAWLVALASWPAGRVTELTAALPSALAGLATAIVIYLLGRQLFDARAGWFAGLAAITTQGFFVHARLPMPDMLMTLFITAALAMFWMMISRHPGAWWIGFYGFTAAAFWAKGPAGLLPLAVALTCVLVGRRPGAWRDLRLPQGLALLLFLTAPWWIREALSDHDAVRRVVVVDYLLWYLPYRPTANLAAPVQHLFGILFPWVLVVPAALAQAKRVIREERGEERDGVMFLLIWAVVLVVFVGISRQQRLRYYLPLLPPIALLIGWWTASLSARRTPARGIPWRAYAVAVGVLAAATVTYVLLHPGWMRTLEGALPSSAGEVLVLTGALALMIAALLYGVQRRQVAQAFVLAWAASAVLVAGTYRWHTNRLNAAYDYPRLRAQIQAQLRDPVLVATSGVQELPFAFYFGQPVVAVETPADIQRTLAENPRRVAVLSDSAVARFEDPANLRVLLRDRLAFRPISIVSYSPGR